MYVDRNERFGAAHSENSPISPNMIAHLEEMVGFDEPDFLVELLDTYLEDSGRTIKKLAPGLAKSGCVWHYARGA